jgi:3-hydroxybutyryl-CoA dehydrogenase
VVSTMSPPIHVLGIIGIGTMGRGIAELAASRGIEVIAIDRTERALATGKQAIHHSLASQLAKWAITEAEMKVTLSRITFSTDLAALANADLLLECIVEDLPSMQKLFQKIGQVAKPDALLASNTSTLSITELAAASGRPEQFVGLHFLHPVLRTEVVELVRGLKTSDQTVARATEVVKYLGRAAVEVYESTGYVTTRLIAPLINEAILTLMEGVATIEGIDTAMRLGFQMKYGPLELADRMGLDVLLLRLERLWKEYGDMKFRPAPLLKKLVRAGHLGAEVGHGFFLYDQDGRRVGVAKL